MAICGLLVYLTLDNSDIQILDQPLQPKSGENNTKATHVELSVEDIGRETNIQDESRIKIILWYDTYRHSMVGQARKVDFSKCVFRGCQINYMITHKDTRASKALDADAVLVQSMTIS